MEEHNTNGGTEERKYYYHEKENSSDDEEHDDYKDNGVHEDVPTWEKYPTGAEAPDRSLIYFPKGNSRIVDVAGGDLGVPQLVSPDTHDKILDIIQQARNHFEDFVKLDTAYSPVRQICKNKHENCALWATMGECESNPGYMRTHCAPLCQSCKDLHVDTRCPVDPNAPNTWQPGGLNKMFERILSDPELQKYEPTVFSRPSYADGDTEETADYQLGPWVVTLDNFLTEDESQRLIELGALEGYRRSSDVGKPNKDGTFTQKISQSRTSENAWCKNGCYDDSVTQTVLERMSMVTQIHDTYAEHLQLLKYEVGEYYKTHHDYIPAEKGRARGVRILTMFLYLNDVEEGGGTNFPDLDITVMPKQGRVLLWPSVHNEAPHSRDTRTEHQALPVKAGTKYGANAWYHQRDFKTPHSLGCG